MQDPKNYLDAFNTTGLSTLEKPKKKSKEYYDYRECRDFIENKFGYKTRDYLNKYNKSFNEEINDVKFLDFWSWIVKNYEISNGCFICFSREFLEESDIEDWQARIYNDFLDEFADENGEVEFYVWW